MMLPTLRACRILPVVTANDVEATVQLAAALLRGGMRAIEITLRTAAALDSIRAVQAEVPDMLVAAGTVTTPAELQRVLEADVKLVLSPGATPALLQAARESAVDFIPGVASASGSSLTSIHRKYPAAPQGCAGHSREVRSSERKGRAAVAQTREKPHDHERVGAVCRTGGGPSSGAGGSRFAVRKHPAERDPPFR